MQRVTFPLGVKALIEASAGNVYSAQFTLLLIDAASGWTPSVGSATIGDIAPYELSTSGYARSIIPIIDVTSTGANVNLVANGVVYPAIGSIPYEMVSSVVVAYGVSDAAPLLCALHGVNAQLNGDQLTLNLSSAGFMRFSVVAA